jgi:DNA-directed RNA polymerase specialized sigma24 family protein
VLVLRALEGYSHKEIAGLLDISVSTSKTQYSRALTLLNRKLKGKIYAD